MKMNEEKRKLDGMDGWNGELKVEEKRSLHVWT